MPGVSSHSTKGITNAASNIRKAVKAQYLPRQFVNFPETPRLLAEEPGRH